MQTEQVLEEEMEDGLKYTETTGSIVNTLPVRYAYLWKVGVDEPVSDLEVLSFRQRFGAVSLPVEGIGGVETLPQFRRQGLLRKLLTKTIAGSSQRVPVLFVSDAIEEVYEKFGFVTCLIEAILMIPVRNVERMNMQRTFATTQHVRSFTQVDLPAMVRLYNDMHAQRTWTHERTSVWNRLLATETWQPGSEVLIVERDARIVGYAIWKGQLFGHTTSPFVVDELTALDSEAAGILFIEMAVRCWQMRFSDFQIREPLDSVVGREAQRLGCEYRQTFLPSGGMMGMILERQKLLATLEPELQRRLPSETLRITHTIAFASLLSGELLPDNSVLLRLLLGYWSMAEALAYGTVIPTAYEQLCDAWFPGSTRLGSIPYAHKLDRY